MKTITLTTEQAQQIEEIVEHLLVDHPTARHHKACVEALSIIRAARAQEQAEQEPVAWGVFYFRGRREGKLYSHCDTKEQAIAYIADRHRSDDTNTFRAAPIYTAQQPVNKNPMVDAFDWQRLYEIEKKRSQMWKDKYEKDIKPLTRIIAMDTTPQPTQKVSESVTKQEPVAEVTLDYSTKHGCYEPDGKLNGITWLTGSGYNEKLIPAGTKLYAAPVRTKDLTGEEIERILTEQPNGEHMNLHWFYNAARAVIAADREKNK